MGRKPDLFHDLFLTLAVLLWLLWPCNTDRSQERAKNIILKGAENFLVFSKGAKFCFLHSISIQQLVKMIYVLWK